MRRLAPLFAVFLFGTACQSSSDDLLVGQWQAVQLRNDGLQDLIRQERALLDTIGRQTPPSEWEARFGTRNLDSLKEEGRAALDGLEAQQSAALRDTRFEFREDGIALVNFGEGPDSARYKLNEENRLVLDELALKGAGANLVMDVERLTADSLRLRFTDNGTTSTVSFTRMRGK